MRLQRGGSSKSKNGTLGEGQPLINIKGVKGESSLFFTVVCVNVFSYHNDVIFFVF